MSISPQIERFLVERDPDFARHVALDSISRRLEEAEPRPARKRRPDPIAMAKRAMASGLNVKSVSATADGVIMTFNDELPAITDASVIETADELRRLI